MAKPTAKNLGDQVAGRAGLCPATSRRLLASSASLALVMAMGGASHALAQSVSGTGDVNPAAPVSPAPPSWTVSGELDVGDASDGDLTIDGGGTVNSDSAIIGVNAGAHGSVIVQGAASTWTNPGALAVGYTGTGTLNINSGGRVDAGATTLGLDVGGVGHLTVDGQNSSFVSTARIGLGQGGSGHLLIQNRGSVSNNDAIVGASSQGDAVVTGPGSTWANARQLTIGSFGPGTLRIEAGGAVTSNQGYIGASDDGLGGRGNGTVVVTGLGSSWMMNPFTLTIGNFGTGSLTIENGGLVRAEAGVLVGASTGGVGTLTVQSATANPGILETSGITSGAGTASVTFDGGLLRATRNNSTFFSFGAQDVTLGANGVVVDTNGHDIGVAPRFVGAGGLTKTGAGALVLTGANTYAGPTQANGGRLEIDGDQTAATGLTTVAANATLGGTGIVGGNVAVNGGAITPGTAGSPGALTINGDLSLDGASRLNYRLGQAGTVGGTLNDLLVVRGDLALNGTLNVTQSIGGVFGPGIYRLIRYDGSLSGAGLTLGTLPPGGSNMVQTSIANQVNLINAGLPPPSSGPHNFWDGDTGVANDGVITGGNGVWHGGTGSVWTEADGATNGQFINGIFAIFAALPGAVTVDNGAGAVSVSGMQFASDGYKISSGAIGLDAGDAVVRVGDGTSQGAAFKATIASELTGLGQLDKTDLGTLILTGANGYTGGTKVSFGALQLGDGGTSGSIQGDVAVDGVLAFNRSDAATFGGAISGAGLVQQIGPGTTILAADSSAFTGRTAILAGTLEVDGALGGSMRVLQGGRLTGVGQVGATANHGMIAPGRGGFGTLTVAGDYAGLGGGLQIETQLGGDNSRTDRLVVTGSASGATPVTVTNVGGPGARTQQGIQVVQVKGVSSGQFTLANGVYAIAGQPALVAGAYGYVLQKDHGDGGWYLRSSLPDGRDRGGSTAPLYQPGVPVYEAYANMLLSLSRFSTLRQRVGDRRYDAADTDHTSVWARVEAMTSHLEPPVSTSGVHQDIDSWRAQFGVDRVLSGAEGGSRLIGGLTAHIGTADTLLSSAYGRGDIDTKAYGVGATLTWYGRQGAYVDAQAQATWFDSDLGSKLVGRLAEGQNGHGYGLSAETGKAFSIKDGLSVTPQAQLSYTSTGFDAFNDRFAANVDSNRGDRLLGRVGLALDHAHSWKDPAGQARQLSLYGVADVKYDFLDGTRVRVSGTPIDSRQGRTWGGLGAGGNYSWGGRYSLYGEVVADTDLSSFGDSYTVTATAGFRMRF